MSDLPGDMKTDPGKNAPKPRETTRRRLLPDFKVMGRFGLVGILATLVYFVVTSLLGRPPIGLDPVVANTIGVAVSLLLSYVGHHRYTFQVRDGHQRYLPRFLVVTAALFVLSSAGMAIARYIWGFDHVVVTAVITICYPVASYLLNSLWTFSHRHQPAGATPE